MFQHRTLLLQHFRSNTTTKVSNCYNSKLLRLLTSTPTTSTITEPPNQITTTTTTSSSPLPIPPEETTNHEWKIKLHPTSHRPMWYNVKTFETTFEKPTFDVAKKFKKPQYATSWSDEQFPDWVQFIDVSSKRHYYLNRATGHVQWNPPGSEDEEEDIFFKEIQRDRTRLSTIPYHEMIPAPPLHRFSAMMIDIGVSCMIGFVSAGLVGVIEFGRINDAIPSIPFSIWLSFLARDSIFEYGTRSIGKRMMKLEIVRWNGKLPTRRHTIMRQIYLPVYAGATLLLPYVVLLPIVDLGLMLFTPQAFRLGDILGYTRVIREHPGRLKRMQELQEYREDEELKE
jgi:uncharacterized RDD family membrane protein YckC